MMQDTKGTLRGQDSIVYTAAGLKIQLSAPLCSLNEIQRRLYASKWRGTPTKAATSIAGKHLYLGSSQTAKSHSQPKDMTRPTTSPTVGSGLLRRIDVCQTFATCMYRHVFFRGGGGLIDWTDKKTNPELITSFHPPLPPRLWEQAALKH